MRVFQAGCILQFEYTNYKGTTATRTVNFSGLDYGDNEWYPERQWFLRGWDRDKNAFRSFAIAKIDGDKIEVLS